MFRRLARLNGWQRLWFVFAVISFILTTIFVFLAQKPTSAVEDIHTLAELNKDQTIRVNIPKLGTVSFPNTMSEKEVEKLIDTYYERNIDTIPKLAAKLLHERNQSQAERAQADGAQVRSANLRFTGLSYLIWLGGVIAIYLLGLSVGWTYQGFKQSQQN